MRISMTIALEIFTNPNDLEIIVRKKRYDSMFCIGVFRGPLGNCKHLFISQPFAKDSEDAITEVKKILEEVCKMVNGINGKHGSLPTRYLNSCKQKINQSKVLNVDLINQIVDDLRQHSVAKTYEELDTVSV